VNEVRPAAPFGYVPEIVFRNLSWMDHLAGSRFPALAGWHKNYQEVFAVMNSVTHQIFSQFQIDGRPARPENDVWFGQGGEGFGWGDCPPRSRDPPHAIRGADQDPGPGCGAGQLLVGMAAAQLAGEDFLVGLDRQRADGAGQALSPVPGLACSTATGLARRMSAGQWAAVPALWGFTTLPRGLSWASTRLARTR
jgi:hypothetical protein